MLGRPIDLQVRIAGVGRVDLVVGGWIVVECDSKEFDESWAAQMETAVATAAIPRDRADGAGRG